MKNEQLWYSSFGSGSYPLSFHKVLDGQPVRIWTKINSPYAPWKPNLNFPKFEDTESAQAWLDENYRRYEG